ncbi:hypothetical protein RclHR1_08750008 [Rhizophagus clarus]|uniref:BTB/POZ domain-containing protein n=1 Tax=Rhizophagus clarus TaxID=94130 RepID=A0A2Z6SP19_9GLOM|nr:hypothetical protein RclHR1_08750008 [Rhizophagus clarus]GES79383.1 BTB/POZ domain-containing protein [Rhizophagus clarus]
MLKTQQSIVHYYEDGDILITVQQTVFRLHRNFLAMASKVFEDMFSFATKSDINNENVSCLTLTDTSATAFENLLTFLYPRKYIRISWENVASFLEIGDKYEIVVVIGASEEFLQFHYMENPLIAFALADQYDFKFVYKESSKLVLNNLPRFKTSPDFHKLSYKASSSLLSKHLDYILAIGNLLELNIQEYRHICSYSVTHGEFIKKVFSDRIKSVKGFPVVSPTKLYEIFFKFEEEDERYDDCQKSFLKTYLPGIFSFYFGDFEPLNSDKNKHNVEHYLYLESMN